ncbi:hypothetical protein BX600DRAFT_152484 [Xylariales sp. PMI_506]|nr:hypothetical protein BX600DRAFT_152484 [Xylariales sp. PMI_506]
MRWLDFGPDWVPTCHSGIAVSRNILISYLPECSYAAEKPKLRFQVVFQPAGLFQPLYRVRTMLGLYSQPAQSRGISPLNFISSSSQPAVDLRMRIDMANEQEFTTCARPSHPCNTIYHPGPDQQYSTFWSACSSGSDRTHTRVPHRHNLR